MNYSEEQRENVAVGTSIVRVQATDRDQVDTVNSRVTYSLADVVGKEDTQFFTINNMTGTIANAITLVSLPVYSELVFMQHICRTGNLMTATVS